MKGVQWWCFASGRAWDWTWRPYPGVWIFLLLVAGGYAWRLRRSTRAAPGGTRRHSLIGAAGLLALWVGVDWPVGALGSGYLASVHAVQYYLVSLLAPALLTFGTARASAPVIPSEPARRFQPHPAVSFVLFNAVTVVTHVPTVVDGLMSSAVGAFVIDLAWFAAGFAFWWPLREPVAHGRGFTLPACLVYVLVSSLPHGGIAMYLLLARYPVYATYELAPPIPRVSAMLDQALAGGVMLFAGMAVTVTVAGALFFRWTREEEALSTFS